jgi:hypothetical protein
VSSMQAKHAHAHTQPDRQTPVLQDNLSTCLVHRSRCVFQSCLWPHHLWQHRAPAARREERALLTAHKKCRCARLSVQSVGPPSICPDTFIGAVCCSKEKAKPGAPPPPKPRALPPEPKKAADEGYMAGLDLPSSSESEDEVENVHRGNIEEEELDTKLLVSLRRCPPPRGGGVLIRSIEL